MIYNSERFAAEVLPQYFNHANWTSFLRQLSAYHFKRVTVNDTPAYEQRDGFFQRNRPDLMALVKRRKDKRRPSATDSADTTTSSTESPPHIVKHQSLDAVNSTANNSTAEHDAEDDNDTATDAQLQHRDRRRRLDSESTTVTTTTNAWQSIPLPLVAPTTTTNPVTPVVPVQIRAGHEYDKILINFSANINLLGIDREFGKVISGLIGNQHATLSADPLAGAASTAAVDELPDQQLVNELGLANSVRRTTIDTDSHATHA